MARNYTKILLVSANVGSIFEDPDKMLKIWLKEFLANVKQMDPDFLAIHCQEVGGKNYEESMQHVNSFIKSLLASPEMQQFDKARVFLDEDFTAVDKFTALGSLYFVHQSVQHVQLYDFKGCKFVPVKGREVLSGNIEEVPIKEKAKFPQEFFPDFKWSRKGFMRTRWNIQNTVFDLVNLHLFHDANNIVAMESSPSVYNGNRSRTLRHTIERFENDQYAKVPYFIFGDFNFRLDTHQLIKKLGENTKVNRVMGKKNDVSKLVYQDPVSEESVLLVEKKGFHHHKHAEVFSNNNGQWLQEYDIETADFQDKLMEYDITFPPSYPFSEDVEDGTSYMKTRCPAWCDRIMFTPDCLDLLYKDDGGGGGSNPEVDYDMMGVNKCMGDHKPIYLKAKLKHGAGSNPVDTVVSSSSSSSDRMSSVVSSFPPSPSSQPATATTTDDAADAAVADAEDSSDFVKQRLKKVISINGEEVEVSSPEAIDQINIHDFASFEKEDALGKQFMNSFRRRRQKRNSFKKVAKDVMRAESFVRALKHYSHRSDSDTEDTDEGAQSPGARRQGSKRRSRYRQHRNNTASTEEEPVPASPDVAGNEVKFGLADEDITPTEMAEVAQVKPDDTQPKSVGAKADGPGATESEPKSSEPPVTLSSVSVAVEPEPSAPIPKNPTIAPLAAGDSLGSLLEPSKPKSSTLPENKPNNNASVDNGKTSPNVNNNASANPSPLASVPPPVLGASGDKLPPNAGGVSGEETEPEKEATSRGKTKRKACCSVM